MDEGKKVGRGHGRFEFEARGYATLALAAALFLVGGAFVGCGPGTGGSQDGSVDAGVDSGSVDYGAPIEGSGSGAADAGVDGGVDGGVDAGTDPGTAACICESPSPCLTAACIGGTCTLTPVADGSVCGEAQICVAGACVERGCGDGYREPGPSPAREGCDDGNQVDGDACSASCESVVQTVDLDGTGDYDAFVGGTSPAVAADGSGKLLVVWLRDRYLDGVTELVARRASSGGAPAPAAVDPIVIDGDVVDALAQPSVVGLRGGGWVVTWTAYRAGTTDVVFRAVRADGSLGAEGSPHAVKTGVQEAGRAAAVGDGFVLAWHDWNATTSDPEAGVRARLFSAEGVALGDEFAVATSRAGRQTYPALASRGDEWLIVWEDAASVGADIYLAGRRFSGATATDGVQFAVSADPGYAPSVAAVEPDAWVIAWATHEADVAGDVRARLVEPGPAADSAATEHAVAAASSTSELWPSAASVPGGGYAIVYRVGTSGASALYLSSDASLGSELMSATTALADGTGLASLSSVPGGVWAAWSRWDTSASAEALHSFYLAPP